MAQTNGFVLSLSTILALRDSQAIPGAGIWLAGEFGGFIIGLEFLPTGFVDEPGLMGAVALGIGGRASFNDFVHVFLLVMAGAYHTKIRGSSEASVDPWTNMESHTDYVVFYPGMRFGHSWHVETGPRIGLGKLEPCTYSTGKCGIRPTFAWSLQAGYRF